MQSKVVISGGFLYKLDKERSSDNEIIDICKLVLKTSIFILGFSLSLKNVGYTVLPLFIHTEYIDRSFNILRFGSFGTSCNDIGTILPAEANS